jgi:hypothetical protein
VLAPQVPFTHCWPVAHAFPHMPQWATLVWVSTQAPEHCTCGSVHIDVPPRPLSVLASELQLAAANKVAARLNNSVTTLFPTSWRWSFTRPILHHGPGSVEASGCDIRAGMLDHF